MRLLPGGFQTDRFPTELEAAPQSALERIPVRPLLALSLVVALGIVAASYSPSVSERVLARCLNSPARRGLEKRTHELRRAF